MTLTQKDPPKGLELLGNILLRSLRNLILKSRQHQQQRRHHMDNCFDDYDGLEWQDWMIIGRCPRILLENGAISSEQTGSGTIRTMNIGT